MPELSIVIPTYKREMRLAFTLDALAEQTAAPERFEVIVVRDSEEGPLTRPPDGLDVRWLTVPAPGPAMRRNAGWRAARAPLIAFTDDDCRPAPQWVEALLAAAGDADGPRGDVILQGRTEPDPDEAHLLYGIARSMDVSGPNRWFPTCNLALPRELLERLGGFDERLAFFGEDTDLGLRAERAGARLRFVDEALVKHAVHVRSLSQALHDATQRHAESSVLARYPDHRRELYLGAFVHPDHAKLLVAAAGLLLWPWSRTAALLAAYVYVHPRLRRRLRNGGRLTPTALARLTLDTALEGAVDGAEVAMRLRSSLRNRSLAL